MKNNLGKFKKNLMGRGRSVGPRVDGEK